MPNVYSTTSWTDYYLSDLRPSTTSPTLYTGSADSFASETSSFGQEPLRLCYRCSFAMSSAFWRQSSSSCIGHYYHWSSPRLRLRWVQVVGSWLSYPNWQGLLFSQTSIWCCSPNWSLSSWLPVASWYQHFGWILLEGCCGCWVRLKELYLNSKPAVHESGAAALLISHLGLYWNSDLDLSSLSLG